MANFNFNKVILGGRITANPELKSTPQGTPVLTFTLAMNRKLKTGESKAEFFRCRAWKERAEFISRYFQKGSTMCLVGTLHAYEYEDKNGIKHDGVEVAVEEIYFVDGKEKTEDDIFGE